MGILLALMGLIMLFIVIVFVFYCECIIRRTEHKNKVHFCVARDLDGSLWLFIGKPFRRANTFHTLMPYCWVRLKNRDVFKYFGLNENDFDSLKWEDDPVEVFVNMED